MAWDDAGHQMRFRMRSAMPIIGCGEVAPDLPPLPPDAAEKPSHVDVSDGRNTLQAPMDR